MQTADLQAASLSKQQERYWRWQQSNQIYGTQAMFQLQGTFEPDTFQQALQQSVQRYEILRTTFSVMPGMELPMQVLGQRIEIRCPLLSLQHLDTAIQQNILEQQWQDLALHSFDLGHGPLLYALLFRLSENHHVLLLRVCTLCADASTLKLLSEEALQRYNVLQQSKTVDIDEDVLQYIDVMSWQKDILSSEGATEQQAFWKTFDLSQLDAVRLPLKPEKEFASLMQDREASLAQHVPIVLETGWQQRLQDLSQRYEASLEACLLACWQILLWRLTDSVPLIGVTFDGRPYEELAAALGPYAHTVPFSLNLNEEVRFQEALAETSLTLREMSEKQLYFNWETLAPERSLAQQIFPISFAFTSWPDQWQASTLVARLQHLSSWNEPAQLQLQATQIGDQLRLQLLYQPTTFSQAEVQRLATLFQTLVGAIIASPQAHVGSLALLSEPEQALQSLRWHGPQHDWPFVPLHQRFQLHAHHQPSAPALRCGDVLLSYQQLEDTANQLAHLLLAHGLLPGQRVALYQHRDQWAIICLLAVLKAGGCYAPVDEDLPPTRVHLLLQQLAPVTLICSQALQASLPDCSFPILLVESLPSLLASLPTSAPQVTILPEHEASLISTSGSTGTPKGVQISQLSISNYTQALCELLDLPTGWHFATVSSLAADLGNTSIFCALASGGCLHLLPYSLVTDGAAFASYVARFPLDVLKIVPTHLHALLSSGATGILPRQRLILGGEALPWTLVELLQQGHDLPPCCQLYNHYGPTETTIGALVNPLGPLARIRVPDPQGRGYSVPIGRPIANLRVAIWDAEHHPVPQGIKGELFLAGAGVALGYLGAPELTAQRFLHVQGARWYRTGDIVRENEQGLIEFVGRRDAQVKLRGYRIELGEIEAQLRTHPDVRETVVQLRNDGPNGEAYLVGYIVPWKQPGPDQQTIREDLAHCLPSYLVPKRIVCLEQFPLSANGKLDRRRLPSPPPESAEQMRQEPIEEPRTPIEALIQQIWRQVLQVHEIGRSDDFFRLGGHSLLGTRMIAHVRSAFGVEVPITWLFEAPTIAGLAQRIDEAIRQGHGLAFPALLPAARDQILPLSFAQQRLWFLDQLEPGSTAYTIPRMLRLHGTLDHHALEQALHRVIERHENLRTTFPSEHGEPRQEIHPHALTSLRLLDLRHLAAAAREEQASSLAQQEVARPFDLARGPLLRVWLLHLTQEEYVLLLTMHHIISDGWSSGLLVQELTTLYAGLQQGTPVELPVLPVQYADYALWQRTWLQGAILERQLDYWKTQLAGLSPLDLPTDHPRTAIAPSRGAQQRVQLSQELSQQLQALSQREGVTLFMTLLAAFQVLLTRYSGQSDIAVGTPIANRTHQEIEGLIGFFINMLVLRSDLSDNPTFRDLLTRVRSAALGAYAHQDVPFEQVVEAVPAPRERNRSPLFQVIFALQNAPDATISAEQSSIQVEEDAGELKMSTAKFELSMIMLEGKQGLNTTLEYTTDLFTDASIAHFLSCWQQLLAAIVANPEQHILALPLLTTAESKPAQLDCHILPPAKVAQYEEALARSLTNTYPLVLDEVLQPVPSGIVGQLYIGGLALAHKIDPQAEMAQERFIPDPWSDQPGAQLYRTGDRVRYRASGELEYLDHIEHPRQITLNGLQLSLDELEDIVLRLTTVQSCRIITRKNQSGVQELVAYMVTTAQGSPEIWREQLHASLSEEWIPQSYILVSHLPLTKTGEIDDQALRAIAPLTVQTLTQWEQYLRKQEGVEQVAVVLKEHTTTKLPLHLADLLPEGGEHTQLQTQTQEEPTNAPQPEYSLVAQETTRSLATGRFLELDQDITMLPQMLLRAAREQNDARLIYILPDGSEQISTYQQLLTEAQHVLAGLRQLGVRPQDKVIIQVEWCQEFLPVIWGCLLGGMVAVPVSIAPTYAQPTSASNRLFHAWKMLGQPVVVAGTNVAAPLQALAESEDWSNFSVVPYSTIKVSSATDVTYYEEGQPDDLALILLTSGSTGAPKGVTQCHRSLLSQIQGMIQQMGCIPQQGVTFNWMPLDHVGGVVMLHFHALYLCDTQIHTLSQNVLQDPLRWLDYIERYRATTTWAPNFAFGLINELAEEIQQRHWDLSSMHNLINAGEAIVAKVARTFMHLMQPHGLSTTAMLPVWGMSETCSGVTFSIFPYESNDATNQMVEVGEPIPGFSVRIVDKNYQVVEEGRIGNLQVYGPSVTRGYYQNQEATQASFTPDGWFDTGDLGMMKAGQLTITGRAKDTIIINGLNYYSQEIEAAVEELEEVETSYTAACAVRDGESTTDQLAVFVVSRVEETQLLDMLRKVRAKVSSRVGITPTYVLPVTKDDIPKTGIGKIQRPQLKKEFEAGQYKELLKELDRRMGNANTLPDWFYRKSWQRRTLSQQSPVVTDGVVLILADEAGMGKTLCAQLRQQQQRCIYIEQGTHFERVSEDHYQIEPNQEADYNLLGAALTIERLTVKYVVHLWGYNPNRIEDSQGGHLKAAYNSGVLSILHLVQTLERGWSREERREGEQIKFVVVSTQVDAIQGDEELAYERAPVVGLLKTFEHELPWLQCVHVDVPNNDQAQNVLHVLQEIHQNKQDSEVAYRAGQRFVARLEHIDWSRQPVQPSPLIQQGFYLISGGLGGLGYELARHLLQEYQAHLLLLGRTPIAQELESTTIVASADTPAAHLAQLQELARHGGSVHYASVDVCDLAGLQQAVHQSQQEWERPLDGIFHLASEFHEVVLLRETARQIEQTLHPKVEGTWTLHQLLKDRPGALFVSYSSVNAFFGGRAVGAYAAANCFLENFAQYQRVHCGLQSYCLSWSMWDEVGMSRGYQFKEFSQARGYYSIAPHHGWYSLLTVLHHAPATVLVGLNGNNQHIRPMLVGPSYALQDAVAYVAPGLQHGPQQGWPAWWGTQPSNYRLVTQRTLPLKETGEVDVERLGGQNHTSGFAAKQEPRTEMEQQILEIWRQVLKNPQVGVLDNFFELGGHSLLATQVVARMQRVFQIGIPVRNIFEHPTVADLAQMLERQHQQSYTAPPLLTVSRDQRLPLSFAQQRLWFLDQLEPGSTAYAIPSAVRLRGPLNHVALEQALYQIILRHENLRTSFPSLEGEPIQRIHAEPQTCLNTLDLRPLPQEEREPRAHFLAQQEVERPFDLANGPLLRATLLLLGEQDQVLLLTMHHIISDGWSNSILIRELTMCYGALLHGEVATTGLPPLPIQYADYAFWQRSWLQGEVLKQQLDYWREQLDGVPPLELPTDHPRPAIQSFRGDRQRIQLSTKQSQELQALSQREGATLFMTLLTSFQILLSRYSGQHDIAVGSPIANRTREEVEGLIGLLTNMLVMRTRFSDDPTFVDMLTQVRGVALGAYSHRDLPFEQVVEALQPQRDRSRSPLFQVLFILQPAAETVETAQASVKIESFAFEQHTAKFELSLIVAENKQGLIATLEYNSDLFEPATITRMLSHWQRLLEGIVANPQQRISELPLLTDQERQQILVDWNHTDAQYHQETLHEGFEQQVARTPDAIALVFENQALTYEALNQFANRLAHRLRRQGVGPDVLVGIRMERSLELMIGLLGILKAGGAYVPLDPTYPADRLAFILEDAQISILLTQSYINEEVPTESQQKICLDQAWHELAGEPASNLPNITLLENAAYCIYTSGSTGNPKGVVLSHRNVMNFFTGMDQQLGEDQPGTWLAVTSISFDISVLELFWTLLRGFRVILQEKLDDVRPVPTSLITKPIDFSLFYFANDAGEKVQDKYRLLLEGAKFADQHGFSAIWTPERHFHAFGGLYPNPSITSAIIAAVTERVQIRAGSVVLPLHSPIRVAEEWSIVDNVSRGRVGVSFASGWQSNDFVLAPDKYADRKEAMFQSIETVRRLWRGEKLALPDGAGNIINVSTLPRPVQPELPVWVTSGGTPETFRMAGEIGANLLTHLLGQDLDELADKIAIYRRAWNEHGHSAQGKTGYVTLMMHAYIGTNMESVRDTVRGPFTEYLRSSVGLIQTMAKSMGMNMRSKDFSADDMDTLLAHAFERYFVTSGLFGTIDNCLAMVQRLKTVGVDEVGCLIDFGVDEDLVLASLHQLAQLKDLSNVQDDECYDDYSVPAQIVRHGVTHLQCTPSLARTLQLLPEIVDGLQGLRKLMLGGEALPLSLVQDIESVSQATLYNMYGPTETTIWSTTALVEKGRDLVSIGSPIANTQVYLLDALLQPVPVGVSGELYIGGVGVARGYHHRPDLTAERFIPDQWSIVPGARLYRTGDTARYLPDGSIEYLGRGDQQIKLRGYRIELGEIEATLLRNPAIRQAIVVVREQTTGDKQLIAYLVPVQDAIVPSNVQLRHLLKESLPDYMVPSAFISLDALPLTPNGKIDRRALAALRPQTQAEASRHISPRDEIEYQLRDIWEEILDISPISVIDNFFELGGHSILAVKLMARIKHTFNHDLPLATLFQRQTVAELATFLREGQGVHVEHPILVPLQPQGNRTPFFCVHATGGEVFGYASLAHYLGEEQPFYGLRMPDPREHEEEFRTLEGIATAYVSAIQQLQPQGPYQLGGWSGGGLVAYEIAQQLQKQGHEVRLLALMDSRPPISDWNMAREDEEGSDDIALTHYFTRRYRVTLPEELAQQGMPEEQFAYVCDLLKQRHLVPQDAGLEHMRQVALTVKIMESTAVRYTLLPYPGHLTLFCSTDAATPEAGQDPAITDAIIHDWEALALQGVEVHRVPGSHITMVEKPYAKDLAAALAQCLDHEQR